MCCSTSRNSSRSLESWITPHEPMRRFILAIVSLRPALIAAGLSLRPDARAADEKRRQAPGRIAFFAGFEDDNREGRLGLYVVDPSTDVLTQVADDPHQERPDRPGEIPALARWPADRLRRDEVRGRLCRLHVDLAPGLSDRTRSLAGSATSRGRPIWSPDGKQLLVVESRRRPITSRSGPSSATWRIDDDGSASGPPADPGDDFQVEDWSPDGRWLVGIARAPGEPGDFEIVIMHPDGTGRRSLTAARPEIVNPGSRPMADRWPSWTSSAAPRVKHEGEEHRRGRPRRQGPPTRLPGAGRRLSSTAASAWSPDGKTPGHGSRDLDPPRVRAP